MIQRIFSIRLLRVWFCATAMILPALVARGELPAARLLSIFPPGAKQGGTVEVTLVGQDLEDLSALHFSDSRISARAGASPNTFVVTVAGQTPVSIYDVRAIGRNGVSNPRAFAVGDLRETAGKPGNTSVEKSAAISIGETISAVAEANAIHYYKLPLKKGQRIFAEISARDIDSRLEPSMLLADAEGNDRAICRRGEMLDFTASADGDYFLKVHDFTYRGGAEFFYRLSVTSGPHIDFILPPAGMAGTRSRYTIFGRNLPGGAAVAGGRASGRGLEQLAVDIELPADPHKAQAEFSYVSSSASFMDGIDYRLTTPLGASNPVRIGFATAPVVARERATGGGLEAKAQKLAVPCEVAGRFWPRSEAQEFTFDAPANSVFWIEVISSRLGNPTAPFLLVQRVGKDEKGAEKISDVQEVYESPANSGGREFSTASRDPVYRLASKEAGTYRIILRDLFTTTTEDGALGYRLLIQAESPDFRLVAFPASPVQEKDSKDAPISTPLLRRGGVTPIEVVALREDGFEGEIQLKMDGLPAGVVCAPTVIAPSATSATLMLSAAEDAPAGFAPVQITGIASIGGKPVTHIARSGTVATSDYDKQNKVVEVASRRAREMFVSIVAERSPLSIALAKDAALETCVFNKISIPLKIARNGEITGPIVLKLTGHPLLAPVKEVTIAPPADSTAIDLDLAQIKLAAGVYDLSAETLVKLKYRAGVEAAKEAEEAAKKAEKAAAESAASAKAAAGRLAAIKPDAPERKAAEQESTESAKKAKDAEAAKVAAAATAKALTARAAPKDMEASFYSKPFRLTVTTSPIGIAPVGGVDVEAGAKVELPIALKRLYGFGDAVEVAIVAPNIKGLSGKVTLAKDQTQTKLSVQTDAATPPGNYAAKLEARVKVGGQTITVEQQVTIKVSAKKALAKDAASQPATKPK